MSTLADLRQDPENARQHNPRNIGMIERALQEVGAARSGRGVEISPGYVAVSLQRLSDMGLQPERLD